MVKQLITEIFSINVSEQLEALSLKVFRFQYENNLIYRDFVNNLGISNREVRSIRDIPFLPVEVFKKHKVISGNEKVQAVFKSSGTTGGLGSSHVITDLSVYNRSFTNCFELFYGKPSNYCILALLPSYLDNAESSLIYMVDEFIKSSGHPDGGFYLDNLNELEEKLSELSNRGDQILLFGVSFALLDFCAKKSAKNIDWSNVTVMETGGMKGRRKEIIRADLHKQLMEVLKVKSIHSEYGMTELLSQSYSKGEGLFNSPPWKKVLIRDVNDPLSYVDYGMRGGINIIDLANIYSCAFISTADLGLAYENGSFEVLGRFDNSDLRGCNLLLE
ncbi:MAG: acyl transferase [Bacteroidetes bacterium]|nr:MAG: acyl transferase [Bacteroidota bacterium]